MSTLSQSNDADSPGTDMDPVCKPAANKRSLKIVWIISLAALFVLVFCGGFVFFYLRIQQKPASQNEVTGNRPLPEAKLIDESNQQLPDSDLRHGRLILVFVTPECDACMKESQFLRTVVGQSNRIPFYGVVSFGEKDVVLREAKDKFPFKVFYDQNLQLAGPLGITRVPVKVFVEDGVIKRAWGGATVDDQAKAAFIKWLDELH